MKQSKNINDLNIDPVLRFPEVLALTGARSRQTIYNWIEKGTFPKPIKIGPNSIGWLKSELELWRDNLINDRN